MHPQTLRAYDQKGLVSPGRSAGGGRRYSLRDVLALREVQRLSQEEGVNLSGIKRILELDRELRRHQQHLAEVTAELTQLRMELESTRAVAARLAGLLRGRSGGAQLVPVHGTGAPGGQPGRPAAGRGRAARAARGRRAVPNSTTNRITGDPEITYGRQAHS